MVDWLRQQQSEQPGHATFQQETIENEQVPYPKIELLRQDVRAARNAFHKKLGEVSAELASPLMDPVFTGGPRWPSIRRAWRAIRRPASTLIVSDGLSDPFFDDENFPLGFKVEVAAETSETLTDVPQSWLFNLVCQVSQLVADNGHVYELLQQHDLLSTAVSIPNLPRRIQTEDGRVGILLNFPAVDIPAEIPTPQGPVKLLVIKLLMPSELRFIDRPGNLETQRNLLIERLNKLPSRHLCLTERAAVV